MCFSELSAALECPALDVLSPSFQLLGDICNRCRFCVYAISTGFAVRLPLRFCLEATSRAHNLLRYLRHVHVDLFRTVADPEQPSSCARAQRPVNAVSERGIQGQAQYSKAPRGKTHGTAVGSRTTSAHARISAHAPPFPSGFLLFLLHTKLPEKPFSRYSSWFHT